MELATLTTLVATSGRDQSGGFSTFWQQDLVMNLVLFNE